MVDLTKAVAAALKKKEKKLNGIGASELGIAEGHSSCPRAYWERARGAKMRDKPDGVRLMLENGHGLHERIATWLYSGLKGSGWFVLETEMDLSGQVEVTLGAPLWVWLRCHADIVLTQENDPGGFAIVDVKTVRGNAFGHLKEARPSHVLQVQAYMMMKDAQEGALLYVDREGQNFCRQFNVERDDDAVKRALTNLLRLRITKAPAEIPHRIEVRRNKGPDSITLKEPWQMGYCDLAECVCRAKYGTPPKGVVAKLDDKLITLTDKVKADKVDATIATLRTRWPDHLIDVPGAEAGE